MNTVYNEQADRHSGRHQGFGKGFIRPAWTPVTIAMMIFGFMVFWPLGLAMIAYILWGDRLDEFKSNVNRKTDAFSGACNRNWRTSSARTGNVAFDDWRDSEIERIEGERRKLDEMRKDFDDHLRELRRAKDQQEFDEFMRATKAKMADGDDRFKPTKPSK